MTSLAPSETRSSDATAFTRKVSTRSSSTVVPTPLIFLKMVISMRTTWTRQQRPSEARTLTSPRTRVTSYPDSVKDKLPNLSWQFRFGIWTLLNGWQFCEETFIHISSFFSRLAPRTSSYPSLCSGARGRPLDALRFVL